MRQRPTQHFISWKPLSARRPQAPETDFFSLPVGSIYIRRENPLQPQSFQTHVRDSGQNVRAVKHFTTGGGEWGGWGGLLNYNRNLCKPQQSRWTHGGQLGLLSGREFKKNQKSLLFVISINQLLFVKL